LVYREWRDLFTRSFTTWLVFLCENMESTTTNKGDNPRSVRRSHDLTLAADDTALTNKVPAAVPAMSTKFSSRKAVVPALTLSKSAAVPAKLHPTTYTSTREAVVHAPSSKEPIAQATLSTDCGVDPKTWWSSRAKSVLSTDPTTTTLAKERTPTSSS